jgi:acetyl esterase/lipase
MMNTLLLWVLLGPPAPVTVTYKTVGEAELKMDVYSPANVQPGTPAVVVLHGGAWVGGDRAQMAALCQAMAANGLVAATASYRLAPANRWPAMVEDAQDAVRFLRDNAAKYSIDPRRVGAAGASAGGHLSLLLGTTDGWPDGKGNAKTSSKVAAVFNIFGPFDCSQDFNPMISSMLAQQIIGKKLEECAEDIKNFSPATYVSKDDAPVFTLQGKADPLVPFKQAERLDAALKAVGVAHTLRLLDGMQHAIDQTKKDQTDAVAEGIAWLKTTLCK